MDGSLSPAHRRVLKDIKKHIAYLDEQVAELDSEIRKIVQSDDCEPWQLLQTSPGINEIAAAGLIAEIGDDMSVFGSRESHIFIVKCWFKASYTSAVYPSTP